MKYTYDQLDQWISGWERTIQAHHQKTAKHRRIASKLQLLADAAIGTGDAMRIAETHEEIVRLQEAVANEDYSDKKLEEVEAEVDRLYGDQSKNDTFYFGSKKKPGV